MSLFVKVIGSQFIELGLVMCSIYNLVAVTISQYLDVVYPTSTVASFWKKHPLIALVSPWIIGISFHLYLDVFHAVIIDNTCYAVGAWNSETEYKFAILFLFFIDSCIPIILFSIMFPQMILRLKKPKVSSGKVRIKLIVLFYYYITVPSNSLVIIII